MQKWDPAFAEYISELDKRKPVVITGDLNCAHKAIDVHSPWTNKKTPGFTEVLFGPFLRWSPPWHKLVIDSSNIHFPAGGKGQL